MFSEQSLGAEEEARPAGIIVAGKISYTCKSLLEIFSRSA